MKINLGYESSPELIENMLNAILEKYPDDPTLPLLYNSGIRYKRDPDERWQTPRETYEKGYGDCEDLALYRAFELRRGGFPAKVKVYRPRPGLLHVFVDRGDGRFEDPSRALGMLDEVSGISGNAVETIDPLTLAATATMGPAGGIAVQLVKTPAGRRLLKSLLK